MSGYVFFFLSRGRVTCGGTTDMNTTSVVIQNIQPDSTDSEVRVAGMLLDGSIGRLSPPLKLNPHVSGKLKYMYKLRP